MNERQILFTPDNVRKVLSGAKTQTRRIMRPQPVPANPVALNRWVWQRSAAHRITLGINAPYQPELLEWCPAGQAGDRLWVREGWATVGTLDHLNPVACYQYDRPPVVYYRADTGASKNSPNRGRWRPSIFMPRWDSRLTLEILSVRVERLHDISELDCEAELGAAPHSLGNDACRQFAGLWDSINGTRAPWSSNPWVWAITFRRVEQ
jgi:hypothetical protein